MIRSFILVLSTLLVTQASAQVFPVFKNPADSVHYEQVRQQLWRSPTDTVQLSRKAFDSLLNVQRQLQKKAFGWSQSYKPSRHFVAFADLKAGKVNPDSVTRLSISNIRSTEVPAEVLACKNLEELELVNTQIDVLQEELNTLPNLTSVYLFNNVPSTRLVLEPNTHVNYLRIAGHHPEKLPRTYKNFRSLDSLNINRSLADRLPNIKKNRELTIVNAVSNNIVLKNYKRNPNLQHLDLRGNKVSRVPGSIGRKYPNLKALSFNTNPVKKVKPGLGKLRHLEFLSFYGTGISEIPKPVYKLSNLHTIDLFDNRIEFISPAVKNLQNLQVLYLANNRLYSLPEEIGALKNLRELYVYNNRMDTLPASMDQLENLEVLWVNDNFFHAIPAPSWRVKNMTYLDASQNYIKQLPDEIAQANLSTLILSRSLMHKERENPDLFARLRQRGTTIIYYSAGRD